MQICSQHYPHNLIHLTLVCVFLSHRFPSSLYPLSISLVGGLSLRMQMTNFEFYLDWNAEIYLWLQTARIERERESEIGGG